MTDKEIIKAFEWCTGGTSDKCRNCPLENERPEAFCVDKLEELVLEMLNRQQAEIERLQKENNQFANIGKMYSEIKSEAIKEYREKVAIKLAANARSDYWHWIDDTLYEVEKELIGDAK